ncbi:MAG: transcriptional regulator [Gammaproteobacteria bacterium]|nr:transcriptional regulator [Gammaproteobacteria bacterium]
MLKLEAVEAFASIAETGSITGAARRLALSKSVISERLADLEHLLGTKLVHRTTRRLSLTQDGRAFYERAKRILRDVDSAVAELSERRGVLAGPLRMSAPVSFGSLHLGPALFGFLEKYPKIELTLELEDRFVDMLAEGYDAVVRHGPVDDKRIIVKRLAVSRRLLVASPDYLKRCGKPASLQDLQRHRGILYTNRAAADWRFRTGRGFATAQPATALRVNNGLLMRDAAVAGLGIALLPTFLLEASLKKRTLGVIDIGCEAEGATVYFAYPEHLRTSGKIRALAAWLEESFRDP